MLDGDDLYLIGIKDVVQYDVISNKIVKKNDKTLEKVKKQILIAINLQL